MISAKFDLVITSIIAWGIFSWSDFNGQVNMTLSFTPMSALISSEGDRLFILDMSNSDIYIYRNIGYDFEYVETLYLSCFLMNIFITNLSDKILARCLSGFEIWDIETNTLLQS
jgi:hypothetical protein